MKKWTVLFPVLALVFTTPAVMAEPAAFRFFQKEIVAGITSGAVKE